MTGSTHFSPNDSNREILHCLSGSLGGPFTFTINLNKKIPSTNRDPKMIDIVKKEKHPTIYDIKEYLDTKYHHKPHNIEMHDFLFEMTKKFGEADELSKIMLDNIYGKAYAIGREIKSSDFDEVFKKIIEKK